MSSKVLSWLFRLKKRRSLWIAVLLMALTTLVLSVTKASLHTELSGGVRRVRNKYEVSADLGLLTVKTSEKRPEAHLGVLRDVNNYKGGGENDAQDSHHDHGHYIVDFPDDPSRWNSTTGDPRLHEGHEDVWVANGSIKLVKNTLSQDSELSVWDPDCEWVRFSKRKPPYYLTAVLLVRIYENDKAKLTTREMKQWLEYLRYAGVEHVYIYDAWVYQNESQEVHLERFLKDNYVTYVDWHTHNPYTISGTQVRAYQDCIEKYGAETEWTAAIDIDEYPFSPKDSKPGFLLRYVKHYTEYHTNIVELTMRNFLFLGKPLDRELLIDRLWRRTHKPANPLVKPIYQPKNVRASIHHNSLFRGRSQDAPHGELRMNHYWGARLQDWGEDTQEILDQTKVDKGMKPVIDAFKKCEKYVRPYIQ